MRSFASDITVNTPNSGKILISKNMKETDNVKIICQSVTGLYEKEIQVYSL